MGKIIAETESLILREFAMGDLDSIYSMYSDTDNTKFIEPLSADRDEERVKLRNYIMYAYGFYGVGFWAVIEKESGRLIGRCGLQIVNIHGEGSYELGYLIIKEKQRKGYATEAVQAILCYAQTVLETGRIIARINKENIASQQFAESMGFKLSGKYDNDMEKDLIFELNI